MTIGFLLNPLSGALQNTDHAAVRESVEAAFRAAGHTIETLETDGDGFSADLERLTGAHDALIVAGGDGTIAAAASHLAGTDKPLGILPFGTMNLVARDLGITAWAEDLPARLAEGPTRRIDVAEVNGHRFMHSVLLGDFADMARSRETLRADGIVPSIESLLDGFAACEQAGDVTTYRVTVGRNRKVLRTRTLLVSNNRIVDRIGFGLARKDLDGERLYLYAPLDRSLWASFLTMLRFATGQWNANPRLDTLASHQIHIEADAGTVRVTIDGELRDLTSPLRFTIRGRALTVMVPRP